MSHLRAALGDFYHCSDHLIEMLLELSLPAGMDFSYTRYPDAIDQRSMIGHDVVLLAVSGRQSPREGVPYWLEPQMAQALSDHVAAGNGIVFFHSSTASYPMDGPIRALCGGHFLHHPPEHPDVTISPVADHAITSGVSAFTHPDEHYFVEVDDDVTQILRSTSTLGDQCAGWYKTHGNGRVAAITPGHTRAMLEDPNLRRLVANAISWAMPGGDR